MATFRRNPAMPVGAGDPSIPYDQSGRSDMSTGGMQLPEPGGPMKKMSFEFNDPNAAAAAPAIPEGAGVPPAGAQGVLPQGVQPQQGQPPEQAPAPGPAASVFGQMAGNADQFGQGPDSSMFTDDMLAGMLQEDPMNPVDLEADQMEQQLPQDPELQMRMMEAARRMGGF